MFHVGEELAVEVLPTCLLSIEGPELEFGDLLATSGRGEEKPAVDGGVDDVVDGLLGGAAGAVDEGALEKAIVVPERGAASTASGRVRSDVTRLAADGGRCGW